MNGGWRDVFKDPVTNPGKSSKKGRFSVVQENGRLRTVAELAAADASKDLLQPVFCNGEILQTSTFAEVKARITL